MSSHKHPKEPAGACLGRLLARLRAFGFRDAWWLLLDLLESYRALRRTLYATGTMIILGTVVTVWIYPWWHERTAVSMARQWLVAGKLDQASTSIQSALKVAPNQPESWTLAADLARRLGNKSSALTYSRHAAKLAPSRLDLVLAWASDALLSDLPEESTRALATLPTGAINQSSLAQRISGELARRRLDLDAARAHFENALRIDGPLAIDEMPLGVVLLKSRDPALRQRGIDLLSKWTTNSDWGANAARTLLQDAIIRNDHPAMRTWAEALRAHPRCTLGDIPNCLLALSRTDEPRFLEVLAVMEKNHAIDAGNIALLVSWLNQIGRSREAIQWVHSLPPALTRQPPAAVSIAESLRNLSDWPGLLAWTQNNDWGRDLESVQLCYQFKAAHEANQTALEQSLWATLQSRASTDGGRTLFNADTLYVWGLRDQSVILLWKASVLPDVGVKALGTLARHYQVAKDAPGQFQVFKQLHSLRPRDRSITNNYTFFAALTGNDTRQAEHAAAQNYNAEPDNLVFRATYAFVLCTQGHPDDALKLLRSAAVSPDNASIIALPLGLALAATHQEKEARSLLLPLLSDDPTQEETLLIQNALKHPTTDR
ncbi:MAG: hypothetical protein WC205_01960 [Opitutaceae bacterium]|jgi:Tfp pilus assembly protein PilF